MQQPASVNRKFILSITISSLAFAGLVYAAAREEPTKDKFGPHGDLNMRAQKAMLDKLLPERDVTQPPPRIDPAIWN
ncbi:MAG TPA: hypothetical protein VHJ19_06500, partial [Gammaproteobacteria bacterium]|nr:hypothetical protein [Gammaproteobacteria bacterium]